MLHVFMFLYNSFNSFHLNHTQTKKKTHLDEILAGHHVNDAVPFKQCNKSI